MKKILFIYFLLTHHLLIAQNNFTISGTVRDNESGETIIGANIFSGKLGEGTATNEYGFYSLTLPKQEDSLTLTFSFVGYNTIQKNISTEANQVINIELKNIALTDVVTISASSYQEKINSTQMGLEQITAKEAKNLPAIFGEVDIIKVLQLKPGVQGGTEGSSGIFVRGGAGDQNLFILDEAPVYNPNHLFGFFSTFNSDAVKGVDLYKSGFPAEYGGKLSSVIDVKMNEGNRKKFSGSGGIGLISSRLTLEAPIVKDKGSFIVSGRRTYFDVFTRALNKANENNRDYNPIPNYYFYDLNAKANYDLGAKDKIFVSGYFGRDVFGFSGRGSAGFNFSFDWGNATSTARWNHIFNPKLFSNTTFTFSDYKYAIQSTFDIFDFEIGSGIRDFNIKSDLSFFPNKNHTVKFGGNFIHHRFNVGQAKFNNESKTIFEAGNKYNALDMALYASDDWTISKKMTLNYGMRLSGFYTYNHLIVGVLNPNFAAKFYVNPEPRLAAKYSIKENISLKASYSRMAQYIHLVSSSGASLPTDVWYPSNAVVKPQLSDQVSTGINWLFKDKFLFSTELYYKRLYRQVDFRDGANLFVNNDLNSEFVFGKGYSYGAEFYVEKKAGKFTGWVGYTLAWTRRRFDGMGNALDAINEGKKFPPRYDRRHSISVVGMYELNRRLRFSLSWVYYTGDAVTVAVSRTFIQDIPGADLKVIPLYTVRNGYRLAPYHRLDLGIVWKVFPKRDADLTFNVYNAYNRRNPFFIYDDIVLSETSPQIPVSIQAKQVSLFPIIPTVTFNFRF